MMKNAKLNGKDIAGDELSIIKTYKIYFPITALSTGNVKFIVFR